MTTPNYTNDLARLITFMSNTATAIRKNTPYGGASCKTWECQHDAMYLSYSIHNFDHLANYIEKGKHELVKKACESLIMQLCWYRDSENPDQEIAGKQCEPNKTFERHKNIVNINDGIKILGDIMAKAEHAIEQQ